MGNSGLIPSVLALLAALPAIKSLPYTPPSYGYSDYPSYPSYTPSYPSYTPSYPSYTPSYPSYTPSYPSYTPSYTPEYTKKEYYPEYDNYDAVTYQEWNISLPCGVVPATNDELYKNAYSDYGYGYQGVSDVLPFGKFPWIVIITDDYNNFLCQGAQVQSHWVLTATSCVEGRDMSSLRVRFGDWDILNDKNEYEAYQNFGSRICSKYPVTDPGYGYTASYGYAETQLTLLRLEFSNNAKYPQTGPVCLPTYYPSYSPPAYPAYNPPSYDYNPAPAYPAYNPPSYDYNPAPAYPSYSAPSYYQAPTYTPTYDYYSDCYVAGWYGSKATALNNHPHPTQVYDGYSYKKESYYPSTYYPEYDQSKIPRFAKVKEIKCPYEYGYAGAQADDSKMCLVGVDGYDACVADKGAAIVCLVPEHVYTYYPEPSYPSYDYTPAYPSYTPSYPSYTPAYPSYTPSYPSYTPAYPSYEPTYYKKPDIKALASPDKLVRQRAVVVAIVQKFAQCSDYKSYSYGQTYQAPQSKPITATKVTDKTVDFIINRYWESNEDYSCPVWKVYYQEPAYYEPSYTPSYSPPSYPSYEPSYPSYTPSYDPPAYSYDYNPPAYTPPSYPSYTPSYPSYSPPSYPSYSPPAYPSYNPPSYY